MPLTYGFIININVARAAHLTTLMGDWAIPSALQTTFLSDAFNA